MAGEKSLLVSASETDPTQAHFISQVISRDEVAPLKEKVFYHVRLWLKQKNIEKEEVLVWISGLSEPIGTTFTDVSGNWNIDSADSTEIYSYMNELEGLMVLDHRYVLAYWS